MTAPDIHDTDADQVAKRRNAGFDDSALLAEVRRLEAQTLGNRRIAKAMGLSMPAKALAVAKSFAIAQESTVRHVARNALAANGAHAVTDGGEVEVIV
jgi:hypothetical protein